MPYEIISTTLVVGAVGVMMQYLANFYTAGKVVDVVGVRYMKFNPFYFKLGTFCFCLAILIALLPLIPYFGINTGKEGELISYIGLVTFLTLGGIYFTSLKRYIVRYDEDKIESLSMWRKPTAISWSEVNKVSFDRRTLYLKLSNGKKSIRVHQHINGFLDFRNYIQEKGKEVIITGWPKWFEEAGLISYRDNRFK